MSLIENKYYLGGNKPQLTITVANSESEWNLFVTEKELKDIRNILEYSPKNSILRAMIVPISTNQHFARDLFLPTFLNRALRVQNLFKKVLACIVALFLDVSTLPIRFATTLPRVIYNKYKNEKPFQRFLREKGAPEQIFKEEKVRATLIWKETAALDKKNPRDVITYNLVERDINFIDVPIFDGVFNHDQEAFVEKTWWETIFGFNDSIIPEGKPVKPLSRKATLWRLPSKSALAQISGMKSGIIIAIALGAVILYKTHVLHDVASWIGSFRTSSCVSRYGPAKTVTLQKAKKIFQCLNFFSFTDNAKDWEQVQKTFSAMSRLHPDNGGIIKSARDILEKTFTKSSQRELKIYECISQIKNPETFRDMTHAKKIFRCGQIDISKNSCDDLIKKGKDILEQISWIGKYAEDQLNDAYSCICRWNNHCEWSPPSSSPFFFTNPPPPVF